VPVVLAPQKEEALEVVGRAARERGAELIQVGKDFQFASLSRALEGQTLQVWRASEDGEVRSTELRIPLLGQHQVENAATAYAALQIACQQGFHIDEEQIREGFWKVTWPGRFEVLQNDPPLVVDCAHNRDSAEKLRKTVDDYFPDKEVICVFGASEDKDIEGMLDELLPRVQQVILVKSYHPRAADPEKLAEIVRKYGKQVQVIPEVTEALDEAMKLGSNGTLVLVTGSIFVAAGARIAWLRRQDEK
jgi:dihydrofolate synthase/folylpolyglutamate synthase